MEAREPASMLPDTSGQTPPVVHSRELRGSVDASGNPLPAESQYSIAASALHMTHKQQLDLRGLVCLIFLEVCGGPFGSEVRWVLGRDGWSAQLAT
jgi:hypothetical protein